MDKFLRNYSLSIQTNPQTNALDEIINVTPPFTLEFDVTRNTLSSANIASFRIYNLNEDTRNKIRKDQFDSDIFQKIVLQAGYGPGPQWPVIFTGNINQAWSVREGNNFITQIESYDGGFAFANAKFSTAFPQNTAQFDILTNMVAGLNQFQVQKGVIGSYNGSISRGNSYSGNTCDILREISGNGFYVDNGKANILAENECFNGILQTIDAQSGLLGTPVREQTLLTFDMLFEPRLLAGQIILLDSQTAKNFNQYYKVVSIKHRGMISDAVCGDAITSVGLFFGTKPLSVVA